MTQTTVLLFTLGMLTSLPAGYGLGWLVDPEGFAARLVEACFGISSLERDIFAFTLMLGANGELREGARG